MYDEMRFLFSVDSNIKNKYNSSDSNKVVNAANPAQSIVYNNEWNEKDKKFNVNQYTINKGDVKNYIKSDVNKPYTANNNNPYLDLLAYTNDPNTSKALKLKSTDFAYLRDIGVLPINRLMILRRYPEGVVVPVDLQDPLISTIEPMATIIGWVKKDTNLLNFSFNETWKVQGSGDMLHLMLAKIIKDEFGVEIDKIIPIPGWGLGFMFGILNQMGLTKFNKTNVPIGNPNLLKEAITRPHEEFGLESNFTFELETVYEQKYISGVDPTVSMLDVLNNLLIMGTSDTEFLGLKGSKILQALRSANENPTNGAGWAYLIGMVSTAFMSALKSAITQVGTDIKALLTPTQDQKTPTSQDNASTDKSTQNVDKSQTKATENLGLFQKALNSTITQSILASTLARYKWPLRGSISMFTGDATTPWHLTIGNPYAPVLSMNNIWVTSVSVTLGKDMAYNDIPRTVEVKVSMKQGRNLGKQEIFSFFGVNYKRKYTLANAPSLVNSVSKQKVNSSTKKLNS